MAKLSQSQVGKRIGIGRSVIAKHEQGRTSPDHGHLEKYCRVYGLSATWLLLGDGEPLERRHTRTDPDWRFMEHQMIELAAMPQTQRHHLISAIGSMIAAAKLAKES